MKDYSKEKLEFISAAQRAAAMNLLRCSSGNLSLRVDEDILILSKSGSWLGELTEQEISVCKISSGEILNKVKPTVEDVFHRGIMSIRPEVNVVLHFQSPNATSIACSSVKYRDFNIIAEVPIYIGEIATVPYILPGSVELATAVINATQKSDLIIMKNHGLVAVGKDLKEVIQKAAFFELACEILIKSDGQINYLSETDIADLNKYILKKK